MDDLIAVGGSYLAYCALDYSRMALGITMTIWLKRVGIKGMEVQGHIYQEGGVMCNAGDWLVLSTAPSAIFQTCG